MSDYMMDLAASHLDYLDRHERTFKDAPRRWMFDENELMRLADIEYETESDAGADLQRLKVYQQWQKPNGEWEWVNA